MYSQYKFAGDRPTFKKNYENPKIQSFLSTRISSKQKCFLAPSSKKYRK